MIKYLVYFALVVFFTACGTNTFEQTNLIGQWKTSSWKVVDSERKINNKMDFTFNSDDTYAIDYGNAKEEGKYWIFGEFLHTAETGQTEKKVKLIRLTKDSMVFEMNRAGSLEKVILLKQN